MLDCDQMEFSSVGSVELGVCLLEGLCWSSGDDSGEGMGDTEAFCVVVGI